MSEFDNYFNGSLNVLFQFLSTIYKIDKFIIRDANKWLTNDKGEPQSIIECKTSDKRLNHDIKYWLFHSYAEDTVNLSGTLIINNTHYHNCLITDYSEERLTLITDRLVKTDKDSYDYYINQYDKITEILKKDPNMIRFLELTEE